MFRGLLFRSPLVFMMFDLECNKCRDVACNVFFAPQITQIFTDYIFCHPDEIIMNRSVVICVICGELKKSTDHLTI